MPLLSDIGKYKRLAELFVLAMKADSIITSSKNNEAIECLVDHGMSERQAQDLIDAAFARLDKGMLRSAEQTVRDIGTYFRRSEHGIILAQLQVIIEAGTISEPSQIFFDVCSQYLYHDV